jgi:hypothetical protein
MYEEDPHFGLLPLLPGNACANRQIYTHQNGRAKDLCPKAKSGESDAEQWTSNHPYVSAVESG